MLFHRIRPALLVAACALLCGPGRSQDKKTPTAPAPRPAKEDPPKLLPKPTAPDREPLRKEVEALFAGQSPEGVVAVLGQLAREWDARKGAYEVARQRFIAQTADLQKARQRVADQKLPVVPPVARAADLPAALKTAQELVDAHTERVKLVGAETDALTALAKTGDELTAAATAADDQLFKLRTAAGLAKDVPADKLPPAFTPSALADAATKLKAEAAEMAPAIAKAKLVPGWGEAVPAAQRAAAAATADLERLKAKQEELAYQDQLKALGAGPLTDEFTKLRKEVAEKSSALTNDEISYTRAGEPVAAAREALEAVYWPAPEQPEPPGECAFLKPSFDTSVKGLAMWQKFWTGRVRAYDTRAKKSAALVAALDEQDGKARDYSNTLNALRTAVTHLAAVAAEIEERVGRGALDASKAPDGLADVRAELSRRRATLDAAAATTQEARERLRDERDKLRAPDVEADSAKSLTEALVANTNERLALHADLKKLAADYATTRATRSEAEQKRLDQKAADRMAKENAQWDIALALDRSKSSTDIGALLSTYYAELMELEEKDQNVKLQKEALEKLARLTEREAENAVKLRAAVQKSDVLSESTEFVDHINRRLSDVNALALKAETHAYQDEVARLSALGNVDARRALALTNDINAARGELLEARARGLITLAVKIGLVLLAALLLPWFLTRVLRRWVRGGTGPDDGPSPVLRPVRAALRVVVWLTALAVVLSILGFDVTAFVVAIAVGVLAVALAARPMIADMLGSVAVSAERRFKVGDVIRLSGGEPARVVSVTWRAVTLKNTNGVVSSVPNRALAEATVENLTRGTETYDTLTVTISTDKDAGKVINVIRAAMTQCKNLTADQGVTVVSYVQKGATKLVQYRFWWFLKDYELRNKTRDEVFARVAVGLAHEDMAGIEIALA